MASPTDSDKLLNFVTNLAGDRFLKVEQDFGSGFVRLNTTEAERRQARHDIRSVEDVVVELVRNSRDAGARLIYLATQKDQLGIRKLVIIDDGAGVPAEFHETVFEPRVTSKVDQIVEDRFGVHGRGMALFSIRSNVDEIRLEHSLPGRGAVFTFTVSTKRLTERKDQSTFPKMKLAGEKMRVLSGPHNILRHLVELTLDSPGVDIFYGTGAEILAALFAWTPGGDGKPAPIWSEIIGLSDAELLSKKAAALLGMKVSARNCQRIVSGEIKAPHSLKCRLRQMAKAQPPIKKSKDPAIRAIAPEDLEGLAQAVSQSFRNLGQKYFLKLKGKPQINCSRDAIHINLPVGSEDSW